MGQDIIVVSSFRDAVVKETVVSLYRYTRCVEVRDKEYLTEKSNTDLLALAKEKLLYNAAKDIVKFVKIDTERNPLDRCYTLTGYLSLPYIHDQILKEKNGRIRYLESVKDSQRSHMAWYREEIAKLEEVIMDISRPWYERLADWMSRP